MLTQAVSQIGICKKAKLTKLVFTTFDKNKIFFLFITAVFWKKRLRKHFGISVNLPRFWVQQRTLLRQPNFSLIKIVEKKTKQNEYKKCNLISIFSIGSTVFLALTNVSTHSWTPQKIFLALKQQFWGKILPCVFYGLNSQNSSSWHGKLISDLTHRFIFKNNASKWRNKPEFPSCDFIVVTQDLANLTVPRFSSCFDVILFLSFSLPNVNVVHLRFDKESRYITAY